MWIDAVCIDQGNNEEKTQQVGIMKEIYRCATQVLIWLGKEAEADRAGFAMLEAYKRSLDTNGIMPPIQS
jgi:hypothetical protein